QAASTREISQLIYEAIIAQDLSPEALDIRGMKKNLRLLATHCALEKHSLNGTKEQATLSSQFDVRSISGGLLLQTPDATGEQEVSYRVVTEREPTLEEVTDLMVAWKVVRNVKSNAIVLAHKLAVRGVGAGQLMSLAWL